jgi:hypothetical protein
MAATNDLTARANSLKSAYEAEVANFDRFTKHAENLQSNVDGRLRWLELLTAINAALPKDTRPRDQRQQTAEDVATRPELHIVRLDVEHVPELATWFSGSGVQNNFQPVTSPAAPPTEQKSDAPAPPEGTAADAAAPEANVTPDGNATTTASSVTPPSGPGYVIELEGHHFHNSLPGSLPYPVTKNGGEGRNFVLNTLCRDLQVGTVELPDGENGTMIQVPIAALGISHPVIITTTRAREQTYSSAAQDELATAKATAPGAAQQPTWNLRRYDFTVQFAWKPVPRSERNQKQKAESSTTSATVMSEQ